MSDWSRVEGRPCNSRSSRLSRSCTNCCSSITMLLIVSAIKAGYGEAEVDILPCIAEKEGRSVVCFGGEAGRFFLLEKRKKLLQGSQPGKLRHWVCDQPQLSSARAPHRCCELAVQSESSKRTVLQKGCSDRRLGKTWTQTRRLHSWFHRSSRPDCSPLQCHERGHLTAATCFLGSRMQMHGGWCATRVAVELIAAVFCGEQRHVAGLRAIVWEDINGCGWWW
jgi:hypothetical protein